MIDLYTKAVLTVIALALCVIAIRGPFMFGAPIDQGSACGSSLQDPCHVTGSVEISKIVSPVQIETGVYGLPVQVQR
jgi:hypothetical protein